MSAKAGSRWLWLVGARATRYRSGVDGRGPVRRIGAPVTIFQKIIDREIPADIVFEDDELLAFRDVNPQAPTHVLIIPKRPIASVAHADGADAALLGRLLLAGAEIARQLGLDEDGYRLVTNVGRDGGQSVFHLHVHLLGGRAMGWPPG